LRERERKKEREKREERREKREERESDTYGDSDVLAGVFIIRIGHRTSDLREELLRINRRKESDAKNLAIFGVSNINYRKTTNQISQSKELGKKPRVQPE
jgi:hypothetical protein